MPGFFETILSQQSEAQQSDRQLLAAWVTAGEAAGAKALFAREEGRYIPVCMEESFPAACAGMIRTLAVGRDGILELENNRVFLEQLSRGRKLVICGAGHVSLSLIRMGVMLDFEVTVIEDREEFASRAGEAGAHQVICRPFEEALDGLAGDETTAFVIMTRAHIHDVDCLRRILTKPYAYAGMMGSRSRTGMIREQMLQEGFDAGKVQALHMPIGLPIGSRTPEEIAVSVMAELISVMNGSDQSEGFPPGMAEELAGLRVTEKTKPERVLAMIVGKSGEAPRRPGTKMLVRKDGSFLGTVGGGSAEAQMLQSAREMLREGSTQSRLVRISMQKGTMHCGGEIEVFLLPL